MMTIKQLRDTLNSLDLSILGEDTVVQFKHSDQGPPFYINYVTIETSPLKVIFREQSRPIY